MKISTARKITLSLVVVIVLVGLIVQTGSGTLSSLGWSVIAYICPLGVVETFLASKLLVPRALIALVGCVIIVVALGKVFCAWLCPIPPLRSFFTFKRDTSVKQALEESTAARDALASQDKKGLSPLCPSGTDALEPAKACPSGCTSCAEKRKKLDSRHLVLGGALLSTAIFGFPVFCIVCPVGLTFASLIALWRLVGFNEPSWALLVFPLILFIELFVLKKWCTKFCPLGAVMSLMSIPNRLFVPRVDTKKCLRSQGVGCKVCTTVCVEGLDPHYRDGMQECTKCGLCKEKCPAAAISLPLRPTRDQ